MGDTLVIQFCTKRFQEAYQVIRATTIVHARATRLDYKAGESLLLSFRLRLVLLLGLPKRLRQQLLEFRVLKLLLGLDLLRRVPDRWLRDQRRACG